MTSLEAERPDLDLHLGQIRFSARAAVLIVRDGQLLLNKFNHADFWFTPGGRIQSGEASEQAARREFLEETGAVLGELRLALVAELFGQMGGEAVHSLQFFYVAAQCPQLPNVSFPNKLDEGVTFDWFALEDLQNLDVRPAFLVGRLPSLLASPEVQHVVDYRE
ncbi:NUDIX domain-containing protein [Deinococcus sp. Arct2-2]|uniref:NUDIX hydrolase n=1 Tax=Deinococcus sp. Arct2-2 TaxID=2568653 RepID=UPI0010A55507|nr:NUDIX domain-containing protein [Deinococcus sp. Arct2-2]THF69484.1 NUDIX domain-containing protein [Deinococcus sp. Arct2-2]